LDLLSTHPQRHDYQQLLHTAVDLSVPIWKEHDGLVPFGIVVLTDDRIALIGGPDQLPTSGVGILHHICTTVRRDLSRYRALGYVHLAMAKGTSLLVVELEHRSGSPLKAYYPLPQHEHWLVEDGVQRIWKQR